MSKRISYLKKLEAVQTVLNNQTSISAVSKDFSVAKSSLSDWIRKLLE
ncbi:transposase [Latilactobacillus sakei]|nr:transposase [Latilactobacillus sakei]MCM1635790.1 transposase [Latilactobacillus sakei]